MKALLIILVLAVMVYNILKTVYLFKNRHFVNFLAKLGFQVSDTKVDMHRKFEAIVEVIVNFILFIIACFV